MTTALNAVAQITVVASSVGSPTSPPANAASFVSAAANIQTLNTQLKTLI